MKTARSFRGEMPRRDICLCVPSPASTRKYCSLTLTTCDEGWACVVGLADALPSMVILMLITYSTSNARSPKLRYIPSRLQ